MTANTATLGASARTRARVAALAAGLMVGVSVFAVTSCSTGGSTKAPVASAAELGGETSMVVAARRLTESQYKHTIADVFGPGVLVDGRFEPETRKDGLLAIGSSALSISAAGFEQYFAVARSVADQVLPTPGANAEQAKAAREARDKVVGCAPADLKGADDKCVEQFVRKYGAQLFRRPLTDAEVAPRVQLAAAGAQQNKDFYAGLKLATISLLTAPEFLFRMETAEVDPAKPSQLRLDGYTKASRLSHLIWDTAPDAELLRLAASGEIHDKKVVEAQIARLMDSPRVEDGVRAFFTDMLQFEWFETLTKDASTYPKFSLAVADSAREQTLKTVVDLLLTKNGDYRDLFTTRDTFLNRPLAAVYQVPYTYSSDWIPYTFPEASGQSGLLTQTTFLSLFSHPGKSSPTKRGVALHEIFMCEPTPLPPPDVDTSLDSIRDPNLKTVRDKLLAHAVREDCVGCHSVSDPAGLALEHFDALGQKRTTENGAVIDVTAEIDGVNFEGAQGLGRVLHDNARIPACVVRNVYSYGVGRAPDDYDQSYLDRQTKVFVDKGYKFPALLQQIAGTPEFFRVVTPTRQEPAPPAPPVARGGDQMLAGRLQP